MALAISWPSALKTAVKTVEKVVNVSRDISRTGFGTPPQLVLDEMKKLSSREDIKADLAAIGRRVGDTVWSSVVKAATGLVGEPPEPPAILRNPWIKSVVMPFVEPVIDSTVARLKEHVRPHLVKGVLAMAATHLGAFMVGRLTKR